MSVHQACFFFVPLVGGNLQLNLTKTQLVVELLSQHRPDRLQRKGVMRYVTRVVKDLGIKNFRLTFCLVQQFSADHHACSARDVTLNPTRYNILSFKSL